MTPMIWRTIGELGIEVIIPRAHKSNASNIWPEINKVFLPYLLSKGIEAIEATMKTKPVMNVKRRDMKRPPPSWLKILVE
jgi:hypothetical protein